MNQKNLKSLLLLTLLLPLTSAQKAVPPASRPTGKDYALFFANETYDNSGSWKTLPGLVKEVEAIAGDLHDLYGFETKVLKNKSLAEIDAELAAWRARSFGPDDQLFVYFSGHGQFVEDRKQGYFIPRDGKGSEGSIYNRQWLPYLDLRRLVSGIGCPHILLALDACFSGTADDEIVFKDETEEWAEPAGAQDKQWNQQIQDQLRCQSRIMLTSGGKTKTENPSKFAAAFRKAFSKQGGADKIVRPSDIMEEWYGLAIAPHATTFEGHEACGNFLFVYQSKATPPQLPVKEPDYDDDGTPDARDKCPNEPGPTATKGCPDTDGDGVADKFDGCKSEKGPVSNDGCPVTTSAPAQVKKPSTVDDPLANAMVYIDGGEFTMGSTEGGANEKPPHKVEISSFWMSKHEVTIGQYLAFCTATDSHWPEWLEKRSQYNMETGKKQDYYKKVGMNQTNTTLPVTGVSWPDAVAFCAWLKEKTGHNYRLPTEAEWEYAARGGKNSKGYTYSGSNNVNEVAWNSSNSESRVHAVGSLKENEAGLYDMSGNVWEWCADRYDAGYYKSSPLKNPQGPTSGTSRVCRGGSWSNLSIICRSAIRYSYNTTNRFYDIGFRVAQDK